jgi:battenin
VISTWASGTGGAGVIGAVSYTLIRMVLDKKQTILAMLVVPIIEILVFFLLLRKPLPMNEQIKNLKKKDAEVDQIENNLKPLHGFVEKFSYIKNLLVYIIPLTVVFLCEYFINQGLVSLASNFKFDKH